MNETETTEKTDGTGKAVIPALFLGISAAYIFGGIGDE